MGHKQICRIVDITANTLRKYLREFLAGGVERLKELHFAVLQGELAGHRAFCT